METEGKHSYYTVHEGNSQTIYSEGVIIKSMRVCGLTTEACDSSLKLGGGV